MKPSLCATLTALPLLAGCVVADPQPIAVRGDGLLTVEWTVHGTADPHECASEGADAIDILVTTPGGASVAEATDDCRASTTIIELPPGSYYADAVLLDSAGHSITSAADLGGFHIYGDDELVVQADFPLDSFF